jgi:nucleoside-diphosphate-sugar epimerase
MKALKGKRIFITGGAGFIASHLCERLARHNQIVVYDNMSRNALRYTALADHKNMEFIQGDVLDADALKSAMKGSQIVIHCAAIAGIYTVVRSPSLTLKVNFLGTYHMLEAAVANKVEKVVDFSTSEVYGPYAYKGTEDDLTSQGPVGESRWAYATGKLAAEHLVYSYHKEHGLAVVILRPFNVYGPRQMGEGAVRGMILRALRDEPIVLYNDGTQIRAWCYVEDFVNGTLAALNEASVVGKTLNLGNPQGSITNLELANMIIRLTPSRSRIAYENHPGPEVQVRVPSIARAQELFGYKPKVGLEEGITRTIAWFREVISKNGNTSF